MRLVALSFARFFARTPWTTLTALFGAALGVASTVAVHLLSLSVADSLDANRAPHLRSLTHVAAKHDATMDDYFELRRRWRAGELPGVRALVPVVEGQIVDGGRRLHIFGADWLALYGLPGARGAARVRPGSVVVDGSLAAGIGEKMLLVGEEWAVSGVVDSGVRGGLFADIGDALVILNAQPNQLSHVGVSLHDPWQQVGDWLETLLPGLSAGLPQTSGSLRQMAGWELRPVSFEQPGTNLANSILFNLGALGTLALMVAWFLIYQVCVLWLRRQAPVMETLAVLGASRAEAGACFLSATALLGVVATLLGLIGGLWLAELLTRLSTVGLGALPSPQLSAPVVGKAMVSGLGVALMGGWLALRRERGSAAAESKAPMRWSAWLFVLVAVGGIGVGVPETGLAGGFLAILAAAFFVIALLQPLLRTLRRRQFERAVNRVVKAGVTPLGSRGLLARLAVGEVAWYGRDVGAALGAMVLAIATSVGMGLMVASFKLDFERMLMQRLAYEHYVEVAGGDAEALARAIALRWPDARLQSYGGLRTRIAGRVVDVDHADYSATEVARYGHGAALGPNTGLASEKLLLDLAVDVGDLVVVAGAPIRIAGSFADFGGVRPRLLLQNGTAVRLFGALHFNTLAVSGVPGADLEGWLAENVPGATVRARERARARALEIFDRSFAISNALTLLALAVAVAGLYNAVTGLRLNRVVTRQLLSALGVSVGEDRLIELIRALGLAAGALALAVPLGLVMGWMLCEVVNPRAFGWRIELSLPFSALAWPTALGFLAAVIAAVAPSPKERFEAG